MPHWTQVGRHATTMSQCVHQSTFSDAYSRTTPLNKSISRRRRSTSRKSVRYLDLQFVVGIIILFQLSLSFFGDTREREQIFEIPKEKMFLHPPQVCMTYWTHFCFSMYLAREFFVAALCAVMHAVYPDAFVTHSSDTIRKLTNDMQKVGCRDESK